MTYLKIIDKNLKDLLQDLGSFRTYLIIAAYVFNFAVLYLVGWHGIDYKLAGISIGLLTVIYALYFKSKSDQAQMQNNSVVSGEPPVDSRDPDDIDS